MCRQLTRHLIVRYCVLALGAIASVPCYAETKPAAGVIELERLEVTGTRMKRAGIEGIAPVVVLDREFIERSGASTTTELFRDVIFNSRGMVDETFTQGFAPASAGVDLRGMGVNRTLVLVNGRRLPIFPFGQDGSASFVDVNLIPLGAVERVEILKDGASAIYGSDAVAGVVNFILREGYEGAEVAVHYGQTGDHDGEEGRVTFTGGASADRGNFTFNLDYLDRNAVWAKDRDLTESANGPFDDRSTAGNPGTIIRAEGFPEPDPRCPPDRINPDRGPFCLYDFAPWNTLIPEVQRLGVAASGDYEIMEGISFFAGGNYTHSDSKRDLAPSTGLFSVSGDNPNTIFPGEDVGVIYRLLELGPRRDKFQTDAYNLLAGFRGTFRDWDWELGGGGGRIDTKITGVSGYTTEGAVQAAVDSGALNLFGDSPSFNPDDITYNTKRRGKSKLYFVDFKATGDVFEMQHGAIGAAIGAEYRKEDFSDKFDPVTESGEVLTIGGTSADGDRDVSAVYAEIGVPVTGDIELQLAARYDHYSDFGGTFNPKLGIRWQPRTDLLLRANAGTGFKAPALHELYSGEIFSFNSVFDPVTGRVTEVPTFASGNPDLDAEESKNFSLGTIWDITDAWNVTADFWRIKNDNAVTSNPQFYVNNEDRFPDNVIRDPDGEIVVIFSPFQNVAAQKLWGIDLGSNTRLRTARAGDFGVNLGATYLGSFKQEPVEGAGYDELAGKDGRPRWRGQGTLTWNRANYGGSLTLNYIGSYERRLEGTDDDHVGSWTTVDAQLNWSPGALRGGTVTAGINNLFDQEPPEDPFLEGWPFFNRALHSARGRFFYANYKHEF